MEKKKKSEYKQHAAESNTRLKCPILFSFYLVLKAAAVSTQTNQDSGLVSRQLRVRIKQHHVYTTSTPTWLMAKQLSVRRCSNLSPVPIDVL